MESRHRRDATRIPQGRDGFEHVGDLLKMTYMEETKENGLKRPNKREFKFSHLGPSICAA